jgi:hypothetical protein
MVYTTPDDCKSALGKRMQYWRSERPDEWLMDEFIAEVEDMYEEIKKLEFMVENGLGYEDLIQDV